jgi:hypothetical protein
MLMVDGRVGIKGLLPNYTDTSWFGQIRADYISLTLPPPVNAALLGLVPEGPSEQVFDLPLFQDPSKSK